MRSDVIGDFHEPYGAILVCGIRFSIPVCVPFLRAVTIAASSTKRPDAMPNPVCVLQILGNVLVDLAACLEDGAVFRQPAHGFLRNLPSATVHAVLAGHGRPAR